MQAGRLWRQPAHIAAATSRGAEPLAPRPRRIRSRTKARRAHRVGWGWRAALEGWGWGGGVISNGAAGTRLYAAPERLVGNFSTPASDMYSAGVCLAEVHGAFGTAMERAKVVGRLAMGVGAGEAAAGVAAGVATGASKERGQLPAQMLRSPLAVKLARALLGAASGRPSAKALHAACAEAAAS